MVNPPSSGDSGGQATVDLQWGLASRGGRSLQTCRRVGGLQFGANRPSGVQVEEKALITLFET